MTLYFRDVLSFFLLAVVGALQSGNHKTSSIGNRNAKVVIPKNRRDFLRDITATTAAVIATTTIGITPPAAGAISPIVTADTAVAAMKFRTSLPPIGLGCWAWGEFQNLLKIMEQISSNHGDKSNIAQVAINWCRAKGTIPIPGARNLSQVKSNYAALNWNLSSEEIALLDDAASFSYISPDAAPFPRKDKDTGLVMFDS
jgi:hypothetical protein